MTNDCNIATGLLQRLVKLRPQQVRFWVVSLELFLLTALTACQGTGVGTTVESAIAPRTAIASNSNVSLPPDFPKEIPLYNGAVLQDIQRSPQVNPKNATARWITRDASSQVIRFYRSAFDRDRWRVLLPTERSEAESQGTFLAQKDDLLVTVSVQSTVGNTDILLQYVRDPKIKVASIDALANAPDPNNPNKLNPQAGDPSFIGPLPNVSTNSTTTSDRPTQAGQVGSFGDLDTVPEPLRPYIRDLSQLGVIDAKNGGGTPPLGNRFEPNAPVSRRDYARWLVLANNRIYQNRPSRQIRLASPNSDTPVFADVPRTDPDFKTIQALANAGLVSSTPNLFRPDGTVSREDMVLWKLPLDLRQPLPAASVDAVKKAWGFQDSDRIAASALKAVLADAQLGDLSNIRRSFGFTTIFQPQKPVTRAEAAAAVWYFGTQTDGLSAQSVLELEKAASNPNQPAVSPSPSPTTEPTP